MKFCNIEFNILSKKELFIRNSNDPKVVVPVNAQVIVLANTNERLLSFINRSNATFDGQIPIRKAQKLNNIVIEKISGSDIVYDFCDFAKKENKSVFFLGGQEDSNYNAVLSIRDKYKITINGFSPKFENYPFSDSFIESCFSEIKKYAPKILFVGFGAPKQEFFIDDNYKKLRELGIEYIICCGGTFEFVSGKIKRAPVWIQKIGLESFYRLFKEFNQARIKRILFSFKFYKYIKHEPDFAEVSKEKQ